MAIYATWMQIDETFRDTKRVRLGWFFRHARTRHAQGYAVMLLLAALTGMVLTLIGIAAERKRFHLRFQANTMQSFNNLWGSINVAPNPHREGTVREKIRVAP